MPHFSVKVVYDQKKGARASHIYNENYLFSAIVPIDPRRKFALPVFSLWVEWRNCSSVEQQGSQNYHRENFTNTVLCIAEDVRSARIENFTTGWIMWPFRIITDFLARQENIMGGPFRSQNVDVYPKYSALAQIQFELINVTRSYFPKTSSVFASWNIYCSRTNRA